MRGRALWSDKDDLQNYLCSAIKPFPRCTTTLTSASFLLLLRLPSSSFGCSDVTSVTLPSFKAVRSLSIHSFDRCACSKLADSAGSAAAAREWRHSRPADGSPASCVHERQVARMRQHSPECQHELPAGSGPKLLQRHPLDRPGSRDGVAGVAEHQCFNMAARAGPHFAAQGARRPPECNTGHRRAYRGPECVLSDSCAASRRWRSRE